MEGREGSYNLMNGYATTEDLSDKSQRSVGSDSPASCR